MSSRRKKKTREETKKGRNVPVKGSYLRGTILCQCREKGERLSKNDSRERGPGDAGPIKNRDLILLYGTSSIVCRKERGRSLSSDRETMKMLDSLEH